MKNQSMRFDVPDGDLSEKRFEFNGFECLALRHPAMGHWCGYIALPVDHPLYGAHYYECSDIEVHGGLSYSEDHAPRHPFDAKWWLGFDTAHCNDYMPGSRSLAGGWKYLSRHRIYRRSAQEARRTVSCYLQE